MLSQKVATPEKYQMLTNATKDLGLNDLDKLRIVNKDALISYQLMIDTIQEFKQEHPEATEQELSAFTMGLIKGRTKHKAIFREK